MGETPIDPRGDRVAALRHERRGERGDRGDRHRHRVELPDAVAWIAPRPAMTKENSPIWARFIPDRMLSRVP
jgi:hypothetical protein